MCPFVEDNEEDIVYGEDSERRFDNGMVSQFFRNDRKYLIIGGTAVIVVAIAIIGIIRSSVTPVNIEELPIIQAETTPIKQKPEKNNQVKHQDKIVYDNISENHRKVVEKVAKKTEEVLSIPEIDVSESLSAEDKKTIIRAFEDLAPDKEYKIDYIEEHSALTKEENRILRVLKNKKKLSAEEKKQLDTLTKKISASYKAEVTAEKSLPPIKSVTNVKTKKKKNRLKDLVVSRANKEKLAQNVSRTRKGTIMVQIASVPSKAAAESEYNRLVSKNRFLKGKGKKIYKVDLGPKKGIMYRVQVGPFKNKDEARKIITAMQGNGCPAYISK